jgi:hypothetical protein
MRPSEDEIETFMDLWMAMKPYISAKDRFDACQKFLMTLEERIDIEEHANEFVGFDGSVDKVIRDNYIEHVELDDYDDEDDW